MPWPTWTELVQILTPIGLGFGWWVKRRDKVAKLEAKVRELTDDLETVTEESGKAQRSHEDALGQKNDEIREWRRATERLERKNERLEDKLERKDARIDELEDRLYAGGGRA